MKSKILDCSLLSEPLVSILEMMADTKSDTYSLTFHDGLKPCASILIARDSDSVKRIESSLDFDYKHNLLNLLALIHRDGGHNQSENGAILSTEQAMNKVLKMREEIELLLVFVRLTGGFKGSDDDIVLNIKDCIR